MRSHGWFASTLLALLCSGCSAYNPLLSSGPYPRVEDCAQIQQATPTKYVCGGKTYTSVQLADIRARTKPDPASAKISGLEPGRLPAPLTAPTKTDR